MILLPFKIFFIFAAFGIWHGTGNDKMAAAAWALFTFLVKLAVIGVTSSMAYYGVGAFLVAWAVFFGLSYLHQSFWLIPASGIGAVVMIIFS